MSYLDELAKDWPNKDPKWGNRSLGLDKACAEVERLRAELSDAKRDGERLDWLEAHPLKAAVHGGSDDGSTGTFWGLGSANLSLRETIDQIAAQSLPSDAKKEGG